MQNIAELAKLIFVLSAGFFAGYWATSATGEETPQTSVTGLPKGAVIAFAGVETCPAGWRAFKPAEGRVVLGYPAYGPHEKVGSAGEIVTRKSSAISMPGVIAPQEMQIPATLSDHTLGYVVLKHCIFEGGQ